MKKEAIKAGDRFKGNRDKAIREVLYVYNNCLFYTYGDKACSTTLDVFLSSNTLIKPEPECLGEIIRLGHPNGSIDTVIKDSNKYVRLLHSGYKEVFIRGGKVYEQQDD